MMKLSLLLEAIDRWSGPIDKAGKSAKGLTKEVSTLDRVVAQSGRTGGVARKEVSALEGAVQHARTGMVNLWHDTALGERIADRINVKVNALGATMRTVAEHDFAKFRSGLTIIHGLANEGIVSLAGLTTRVAMLGVTGAAASAAAGVGLFARGVIDQGLKTEDYIDQLSRIDKSEAKAKAGLAWVRAYAGTSASSVDALTDAYIKARQLGLAPTADTFRTLESEAIVYKKSLSEIVDAYGQAKLGRFRGLAGLDIEAEKKKGQLFFSYLDHEGKRVTQVVADNATARASAILNIFAAMSGGAAQHSANTLAGMWETLKNDVSNFEASTADKGFFNLVEGDLRRALDWVEKITKDGRLDQWSKKASDELVMLWNKADYFIENTNWGQVAAGIGGITANVITLAGWIGKMIDENQRLLLSREAGNIVQEHTGIWGRFYSKADNDKAMARVAEIDNMLNPPPPPKPEQQVRQIGKSVIWPRGSFKPHGTDSDWKRAPAPSPTAPARPGNAKISLDISTDRGTTATPRKVAASGVDVEINTGTAMRAFA